VQEEKDQQQPEEAPPAAEGGEPVPEPAAEEPAAEAQAEEPAAEEPAAAEAAGDEPPAEAPAAEPAEQLSPRAQRKRARATAPTVQRPQRSPEERAQERADERRQKAQARRRWRQKRKNRGKTGADSASRIAGSPQDEAAAAPGTRKSFQGVVVSNKGDKTITVRIDRVGRHRVYGKVVRQSSTLHAHDERNEAGEGDVVRVVEARPLSRTKRWRLIQVLEKAK
jgi:small subunit ribosomal protein S17